MSRRSIAVVVEADDSFTLEIPSPARGAYVVDLAVLVELVNRHNAIVRDLRRPSAPPRQAPPIPSTTRRRWSP